MLVVALTLLAASNPAYAQEWLPDGCNWYYIDDPASTYPCEAWCGSHEIG